MVAGQLAKLYANRLATAGKLVPVMAAATKKRSMNMKGEALHRIPVQSTGVLQHPMQRILRRFVMHRIVQSKVNRQMKQNTLFIFVIFVVVALHLLYRRKKVMVTNMDIAAAVKEATRASDSQRI